MIDSAALLPKYLRAAQPSFTCGADVVGWVIFTSRQEFSMSIEEQRPRDRMFHSSQLDAVSQQRLTAWEHDLDAKAERFVTASKTITGGPGPGTARRSMGNLVFANERLMLPGI
jgi:hypothetical protein